jgi:hypothetical protein
VARHTSISTHVFRYVRIKRFDARNKAHAALGANSQALHQAVAAEDSRAVKELERENLELAATYWQLEKSEVVEIQKSLEELS